MYQNLDLTLGVDISVIDYITNKSLSRIKYVIDIFCDICNSLKMLPCKIAIARFFSCILVLIF